MTEFDVDKQKMNAAAAAFELVEDGMLLGLGSGSTSALLIGLVGRSFEAGDLKIRAVCTSKIVEDLAKSHGIPIEPLSLSMPIDLYLDGADQIDDDGVMIKGGGGALLREKLVAMNSRRRVIMVDERKPVKVLGTGFPLPVDLVPFGSDFVSEIIRKKLAPGAVLRRNADKTPYVNSDGNHIVDCQFPLGIDNPPQVAELLRSIPGVVEVGLFFGFCDELLIGTNDGVERRTFNHHVELFD